MKKVRRYDVKPLAIGRAKVALNLEELKLINLLCRITDDGYGKAD